jgi:predicted nucleic acid-binding protein
VSGVLLDTDVLVDHLRGHRRLELVDPAWSISVVTRCELFAGRHADEPRLRQTLARLVELAVDGELAESAGRLRRTTQLAVPDALIAATALAHELPLMTRNRRHFERVPGLTLHDPPTARGAGAAPQD